MPELGRAGQPRGWPSRGTMPHFDSNDVIQHVTIHLADSLPKDALEHIAAELAGMDPEHREEEKRSRVEALFDAGHGACVLRRPDCAGIVQDSLLHSDGERYRMLAWVIMPNHVHTLFQVMNGWQMAKVVASWKTWTGSQISDLLLKERPARERRAPSRHDEAETRHHGGWRPRVWHREYWDRCIRDEQHFASAVAYIYDNPVKAGLVGRAEDWPWSSAGNAGYRPPALTDSATTEGGGPGDGSV